MSLRWFIFVEGSKPAREVKSAAVPVAPAQRSLHGFRIIFPSDVFPSQAAITLDHRDKAGESFRKIDNRRFSFQIPALDPEVYEECPSRGFAVYFPFMLRIVADILSEHNGCVLEGNIKYVFIIQLHCMLIHSEHPQLPHNGVVWR